MDNNKEIHNNIPDISLEELRGITWQYFIQANNKKVSFRIFLSNDALIIKEKIIKFFEVSIKSHISEHISHNKALIKALKEYKL